MGGGYTLSRIAKSQGARLWLGLILSFLCAVLLLCCAFLLPLNIKLSYAEAVNVSYVTVADGKDLLLSDYSMKKNGQVFDGGVLLDLYAKLSGKNKTFVDVESNANKMRLGTEKGEIHTGLDSEDIRVINNGSNVVVKFGNMNWTVVSLTTDNSKNVILTLWLTDVAFYSKFNNWGIGTWNNEYPSSMYSSSYIRARLLNGVDSNGEAVKYVANAGDNFLTPLQEGDLISNYPFNIFNVNPTVNADNTVNRSNGSITDFLVKPIDIPYQQTESMYDYANAKTNSGWKQAQNDALGNIGVSKWANENISKTQDKKGYTDWGNDYLWLPSWVEVGYGSPTNSKFNAGGLWNTNAALRSSSGINSMRSGDNNGSQGYNYCLDKDGYNVAELVGVNSVGVRPAIHLNLTAAVEEVKSSHIHAFGEWQITKSATCTVAGEKKHTCSVAGCFLAGGIEIKSIPATGHDYADEYTIDIPATCTTTGSKSKHCKNCDDKISITQIPILNHDWGEWIAVVVPSCTTNGKERHYCTREGCMESEERTVDKVSHPYIDTVIPPTCTENGYTKHVCSVCRDEYNDSTVEATGHNYVKGETIAPTPTTAGYTVYTCANCGDSHNDDIIPALGHDYQVSKVTSPMCTENGYTTYTCSDCGDSYNADYVDALGHDYQSHKVAPDCENDGYTRYTCSRCGDYYDEDIIPALGHDYGDAVWEWADDFFTATVTFYCSHGDEHTMKMPAKIDEKRTTATCTQKGDAVFVGEVVFNGVTYTDTQSVSGTTIPHVCEVTWTWNDDYTTSADVKCTSCGTSFEPEITIAYDEESKTYTAMFELDGITYSDVKTVDTEPIPDDTKPNEKDDRVVDFGKVSEILKEWWQVVASAISIIFIIIFMSKGIGYAQKKKQVKRTMTKKYNASYYAGVTGLFGLPMIGWTAIACVLIGLAVLSVVFLLIEKSGYNKVVRELEDAKDEYEKAQAQKRDDDMRMMFMGMMGGQGNNGVQGYVYAQPQIGLEDMRLMINEAVTATLPNVQQYIPQQASNNGNDEIIKSLVKGQQEILRQLAELSAKQNVEPQIIEKVVEKEVKVEVPVEVEKIVEKEVVKEVPVERVVVEKVVEKEINVETPIKVTTSSKAKKEVSQRLALEDAYAKLSKTQQKFFDGLKEYALSKDEKCKEKQSTYFTVIGTSTVNPLIKLTIKKNQTVAMFKLEDEYTKDIRKNATNDGTKVKVKETEIIVSDAQAFKTAKDMIDLREDQIERYQDLLKEQRSIKKR